MKNRYNNFYLKAGALLLVIFGSLLLVGAEKALAVGPTVDPAFGTIDTPLTVACANGTNPNFGIYVWLNGANLGAFRWECSNTMKSLSEFAFDNPNNFNLGSVAGISTNNATFTLTEINFNNQHFDGFTATLANAQASPGFIGEAEFRILDLSGLVEDIDAAQSLLNSTSGMVGPAHGQYPQEVWNAFQAVVNAASVVRDDPAATPQEVNQASVNLAAATTDFLAGLTPFSSEAQLLSFAFAGFDGFVGVIDQDSHTVSVVLPFGTDLTSLVPILTFSDWATIDPDPAIPQDFTNPFIYTITPEDHSAGQEYILTVTVADPANLDSLNDLLAGAQEMIDQANVGNAEGDYPQSVVDELQAAIDSASSFLDQSLDPSVVASAVADLTAAIEVFQSGVIPEPPAPEMSATLAADLGPNSITITWITDHPASSRVVYDVVTHSDADVALAGPANYAYANSTVEDSNLVVSHSVLLSGLSPSTTYYFRSVSHGSPESVGPEITMTTSSSTGVGGPVPVGNTALAPLPPASDAGKILGVTTNRHQTGTLIIDLNKTVYLVGENNIRPFATEAEFYSYRYKFSSVQAATSEDMQLPLGPIMLAADWTLALDAGTIYLIEAGMKRPFASMGDFRKLGYDLKNVRKINLSRYIRGQIVLI